MEAVEVLRITGSDGAANDEFGVTVAVDENVLVVGAFGHDANKGKRYFLLIWYR